jgi:O-antigen/teichoic acid export membrane protein
MGIIQKQSVKSSLFILLGFIIGAINILVLFPRFFTQAEIGLTRAMIDISLTLSVLCTLGSLPVIYKFFPFYNDYTGPEKNDLPMITAIACALGFTITCLVGYFARDFIIRKLGKSPEFGVFFYTVYPYTFFLLLFMWLEAFGWCLKKTALTNFLREASIRIITTILIVLFALKFINLAQFIHLFCLLYLIPAIYLLITLIRSGKWKLKIIPFSSVTKRLKKRMFNFSMFLFGVQFLNVLAKTNDTFLVIGLRGLAETGIFSIALYVSAAMDIPQRSLNSISIPILAEAWKNKDMHRISSIYSKSISNLLVISLAMFGLIWLNIHNLVSFLNHLSSKTNGNYEIISSLVFVMGLSKILDLSTGVNGQIIGTSNYWRFDFYTNVFYTALSIPLNFVLIKYFGLMGLAYSNLVALSLYNIFRYLFLFKKFNLQPYQLKHLVVLMICLAIYFVIHFVPQSPNIYIDILIRSALFILLFTPVVYFSNVAPDLIKIVEDKINLMRVKK